MRKYSLLVTPLTILVVIVLTVNVFAKDTDRLTNDSDALEKLGRGAVNIVYGWFEIIMQPCVGGTKNLHEMFLGIFRGIGYAIGRTAAGIYEVATFPIPIPANYKSVVDPETVFLYSSSSSKNR